LDDIPVSTQAAVLGVLLILSGFFAMAETAMMASNRYRLRALAQSGHRGARLALALLAKTDKLLGVILLFNTLINAAVATLAGLVTVQLFGDDKWVVGVGTVVVSFIILVFAEITPKVIGATYPDKLTLGASFLLTPILRISDPVVSVVNVMVGGLLRLFRLRRNRSHEELSMSPEELRAIVLESTVGVPPQHRSILLNLFDLEQITVDDVMTPRGTVEAIDLQAPLEEIRQQIATSYHTRLPVYDGDPGNIVGILHQRRLLARILDSDWDRDTLREQLAEPYFIPAGTHVYSQLQFFQENRQRLGLVVDEYGEIQGLLTLEDIIEEIIGKFTTSISGATETLTWGEDGTVMVDGTRSLRELNRALALDFPLDGPKTLNGLVLEHFQDIPESGVSARIGGVAMEIIQTQDRAVRIIRLSRPAA
jgi:Mg2+/Co2+ transporter CorB